MKLPFCLMNNRYKDEHFVTILGIGKGEHQDLYFVYKVSDLFFRCVIIYILKKEIQNLFRKILNVIQRSEKIS